VAAMGGNYETTNAVDIGPIVAQDLADTDVIGLGPVADDTEAIIGFSYSLDAA